METINTYFVLTALMWSKLRHIKWKTIHQTIQLITKLKVLPQPNYGYIYINWKTNTQVPHMYLARCNR